MGWDAIAAIAELAGAAGVIVSLVYLSNQIRANTRATRASASFEATHSWALTNETIAQLSEPALESMLRWEDASKGAESLTPVEYMRAVLIYRSVFQKLEGQYYLFKYGLLEPGIWGQRSRIGRGLVELHRGWWDHEALNYSQEFVAALEAAEPIDVRRINRSPGG